ncbi:Reverse transcriptase domain [Cinara cedri]|uniref:Reverse transcriptase domain n=1 Tax=Cinara cedri TaxID=506608 RepID=A0A5E4MCL7_9HEMI|nr:Reverse transcriptase domain [Cinara cedri]
MLRFADDIAVLAENENDLQNTLNIMNDTMRDEFKMKINIKKTNILISSRREEERLRTTNIAIDNESLQQVQEYKYLGSLITAEGTSKKEINLIKTYVWSVVLYGSETWTIAKAEENRLLALKHGVGEGCKE